MRVLARDETEATAGTARIYAWNTVGAIVGAVLAGFVLIPRFGFEGSIRIAVGANFVLALWAAACVARPRPIPVGVAAAGIAAVLAIYSPSRPQAVVSSTGFDLTFASPPRELHYAVGRSSTVMLLASGTYYYLRTNGLPEASIAVRGRPPAIDTQKWLTALTVAARPDTRDMLVVGFGGGVALEGVPSTVERIDVVELEPEVIVANRRLSGMRDNDPLVDPRFNIVINDARNALRLTGKTYDAIISQPSHPWTAGASHLFTREFVADVRRHLNDGGVFLQWMNSDFIDEGLMRTLAATLTAEFDYVRLYHPASRVLMFLASNAPLDVELEAARTGRPFIDDPAHYTQFGLNTVEDLLAALALDEQGLLSFARRAEISTDDNNLMATRSRARADGLFGEDLLLLLEPHDPLGRQGSWVHTLLADSIDYGYLARRLLGTSQTARVTRMAGAIPDFSRQFEVYAHLFRATDQAEQAPEAMLNALRANPLNMQVRYTIARDYLDTIDGGEAPEEIQGIVAELTGPAAATVEGLRYEATDDWASLASLDGVLAESRHTDAWYSETARLRAAWRVNIAETLTAEDTAEDRERLALEALRLIEQVLIMAPSETLHLLRAISARMLGDDHRVLESSAYLTSQINTYLSAAASQENALSPGELAPVRLNLEIIAEQISDDPDIADRQRLSTVLESIEALNRHIDEYTETAESEL